MTKIDFDEPVLGFCDFPHQTNSFVLATKTEIAVLTLQSNGTNTTMTESASMPFKEVEKELLQMAVTPQDATFIDVLILHDDYQLTKLVLNRQKMVFHKKIYSFSLLQQLPYFNEIASHSTIIQPFARAKDFEGNSLLLLYDESAKTVSAFSISTSLDQKLLVQ